MIKIDVPVSNRTIVKRVVVGTPTRVGLPSVGRFLALDDINNAGVSNDNAFVQYDSDTQKFILTNLPTVTGLTWDDVTAQIVVQTRDGFNPNINIDLNPFTTSDLVEGDRKYYTYDRVDSDIGLRLSNIDQHVIPNANEQYDLGSFQFRFRDLYLSGTTIKLGALSLQDASGTFTVRDSNGDVVQLDLSNNSTDDLLEGATNLYYTTSRADSDSRFSISLDVTSGTSDLFSYTPSTGVFAIQDSNIARTDITDTFHQGLNIPDGKSITFNNTDATIGVSSDTFTITNNSDNVLVSELNGGVNLYYNNDRKIHTTDSGATVTGNLRATGNTTVSGVLAVDGAGTDLAGYLNVGAALDVVGATTLTNTTVAGQLQTTTFVTTSSANIQGPVVVVDSATFSDNVSIAGTLDVSGESTLASATVSDLTSGRVVVAGTNGSLDDHTGLTYDGSELVASSVSVSDLTNGRVVIAGAAGSLEDHTGLTYNGTTLTANALDITTNADVTGTLNVTGNTTLSGNASVSGTAAFNDSATFSQKVTVEADVIINNGGALTVAGSTTLQSTLDVTSSLSVGGNLTVDGTTGLFNDLHLRGDLQVDSGATVTGDLGVTGATTLSSTLDVTGETTLNNNLLVDGNTTITGNLTVNGTTTTINSTTVSVNDKNLVLADSAVDSAAANGAGITIGGANATIVYNSSTDTWDLNKPLGDNVNHLVNFSTTDLAEGTNRYYTLARADSDARYAIDVAQASGDGGIAYNPATGIITYTGPSALETRAHFQAIFAGGDGNFTYDSATGNFTVTGPSAAETRVHFSAIDAGGDGSFSYNSSTGAFTYTGPSPAEARAHFTGGTGLAYNSSTGDFRIDSAELEAYFKNDIHGYFTGGTGITRSGGDFRIDSAELAAYFSTNDITEGNNLYYTKVRVDSDINQGFADRTTDNLAEGSNLYYTRARFDSALGDNTSIATIRSYFSAGGDLSYNSSTGQFYFDVEDVYTKSNFDSDFNQALDEAAIGGVGLTYNNTTNTLHIDSAELEAYYKQSIRTYISVTDNGGDGALSYDANTGTISYTGPSATEVRAHFQAIDAGGDGSFTYDSATGNFTYTGPSATETRAHFQVLDLGGDGSLSYDSATGNFTYTGPSATEVRAHLVAGTGTHYDSASGVISIGQPVETNSNVTFNQVTNTTGSTLTSGTGITVSDGNVNVIDTVAHNSGFMSIEYVVHMDDNTNSQSQISKLLLTYNKSNVSYTEYGMTSSFTGDSDMGTLSADVVGSNIRLKFQRSAGLGNIVVKAVKTVIS